LGCYFVKNNGELEILPEVEPDPSLFELRLVVGGSFQDLSDELELVGGD
jgi:hypothetical protein